MHELSVAMSLLDVITEQMIRHNAHRAKSVTLLVGPLSGVVPEALQTAFAIATREGDLAGTTLKIQESTVQLLCEKCGSNQPAVAPNDLRCSVCGELSLHVVQGRELDLLSIEVEDGEEDATTNS